MEDVLIEGNTMVDSDAGPSVTCDERNPDLSRLYTKTRNKRRLKKRGRKKKSRGDAWRNLVGILARGGDRKYYLGIYL